MKKIILYVFIFPILSSSLFSQGLIPISKESYEKCPSIKIDNILGFSQTMPDKYSLEGFVPPVLEQVGASCSGFSVIYYGLSTQYNLELNITNLVDRNGHSFDPYFAYALLNENDQTNDDSCNSGNYIVDVLEILKTKGAKKKFFSPHISCDTPRRFVVDSIINKYTLPYSIDSYSKIPLNSDKGVFYTKKLIKGHQPVTIGMKTTKSLEDVGIGGNYFYKESEGFDIPHGVTIVGYDDNVNGGAFRVVNSWGKDWGDEGYFWLRYKDFDKLVNEAYVIHLSSNINYEENPQIDYDNFKRFTYDQEYSYEGVYNTEPNGQGIYSYYTENGKVNAIGNWIDGKKNGHFILIDEENEVWTINYVNDKIALNNSSLKGNDKNKKALINQELFFQYWSNYEEKPLKKSKTIIIRKMK